MESTTAPAGHIALAPERDQRTGLIVFGAIQILLGGLCAAMLVLIAAVGFLAPSALGDVDRNSIMTGAILYLVMAVILIWLGIGSVLCRRWARTLVLILAWSWLLLGVMTVALVIWFALTLPMEGITGVFFAIALTLTGVFLLMLPGAMVFFYRRPQVQETCEARDPRPRWTDRCPSPVLTNSIWLGMGALWLSTMPLLKQNVVPFFGRLATGPLATMICLAGAAIGLYLAYATYRLKMIGWWGTFAAFGLATASISLTFARMDPADFYRKSGYPEELVAQMENMPFFTATSIAWANAAFFALLVVYMFWIRKFFRKSS